MVYIRKTLDVYEIQVNHGFGQGWECEITETDRKQAKERIKEYKENCTGLLVRIVKKKRERIVT